MVNDRIIDIGLNLVGKKDESVRNTRIIEVGEDLIETCIDRSVVIRPNDVEAISLEISYIDNEIKSIKNKMRNLLKIEEYSKQLFKTKIENLNIKMKKLENQLTFCQYPRLNLNAFNEANKGLPRLILFSLDSRYCVFKVGQASEHYHDIYGMPRKRNKGRKVRMMPHLPKEVARSYEGFNEHFSSSKKVELRAEFISLIPNSIKEDMRSSIFKDHRILAEVEWKKLQENKTGLQWKENNEYEGVLGDEFLVIGESESEELWITDKFTHQPVEV